MSARPSGPVEEASEAMGEAFENFCQSLNLLRDSDVDNVALVRELSLRMNKVTAEMNNLSAWIRAFGRHRMT